MGKTMTKKEFDAMYVGENVVVHCKTEELANEFLRMAHEFGYMWEDSELYTETNEYQSYKENTCYNLFDGMFGNVDFYETEGAKIVEFKSCAELYKVTDIGKFFTYYTDFFFETSNQKFASQFAFKEQAKIGDIVEIVGHGKHSSGNYPEVQIIRNVLTDKIYLTQMDGLEPVQPKLIYPKGVKSVEVKGNLTTVTLGDGRVGYAKCSGADKMDVLTGFSIAYTKAVTGMNAEQLRECLPVVEKKEKLELYHSSTGSEVGTIGKLTQLQDCDGRKLYIGDMVSVTNGFERYSDSVVAENSDCEFVMGICGACKSHGVITGGWKIKYLRPYTDLKVGMKAGEEIGVRVKK